MTLLSAPAVTTRVAHAIFHVRRTDMREIAVAKLPVMLIITPALILSLACATEQGSDLREFVLEDAQKIKVENYKAQLDRGDIPFVLRKGKTTEAFKERTESAAIAFGEQIGRIDQAISVSGPSGSYFISTGEFDLEVFETGLNSSPYLSPVENWFQKDIDAWFDEDDSNIVLFPRHGLLVAGNRGALTALREAFSE